ncbi:hdc homolog, cell cycle regulator isoform X1 [Osmia lignaria lignaria]|uniref:facilitated trehalose transporter Tret1-2 homolog isoform X1 n=1 Tax=Osmia lignaria TaxID=473952 RepID=UPI001478DB82|nr:facilitated trehalose transporter Tret1-2 homolog isoform X1 [Osmia lignaria]
MADDKEDFKKLFRRRLPQYMAATAACLGGFSLGTSLGWSAPCVEILKSQYNYNVFSTNVVASVLPLGAALGMIVVPFLIDKIGRKWTMLALVPPMLLGWLLIISAVSVVGLVITGRFLIGACGGMCCVAAPMYTAEICEKQIRGTLGVFFQLLLVIGILYAYCCGYSRSVIWTSALCGGTPILFACAMIFMPESPLYHLSKNDEDSARKCMRFLRGPDTNFDSEIDAFKEQVEHSHKQKVKLSVFLKKPVLKTLGLAYGMMFAQQFSGINAVIFYGETIFKQTGVEMDSLLQVVIFAVVQVFACVVSALLVDKLGRKFLMMLSMGAMSLCLLALGVFFLVKNKQPDKVSHISWLPLTSACLYILTFCLGAGPIPWAYMGEIFPAKLKGVASSSAAFFNWILAFTVTVSFSTVTDTIGNAPTFFIFSIICTLSVVFLMFFMIETKGKTFAEIQQEFGTFDVED